MTVLQGDAQSCHRTWVIVRFAAALRRIVTEVQRLIIRRSHAERAAALPDLAVAGHVHGVQLKAGTRYVPEQNELEGTGRIGEMPYEIGAIPPVLELRNRCSKSCTTFSARRTLAMTEVDTVPPRSRWEGSPRKKA